MTEESPLHIRVVGLRKSYGAHEVLHDVSFDVLRGLNNVVIGASGSGKTVMMRQLIRLERPDAGQVLVDGVDIVPLGDVQLTTVRRQFGMVFQMSALFDSMNVFDNVAFLLREHTKLKEKEIRTRVLDKLRILGLEGVERRYPSQLSGGMRKRVALARALMLEPKIVVYDEPTSGLDPLTSRMVDELILETRARFGVTSIVISHDMASALKIADYVFLLSKGRIVGHGTPVALVEQKQGLAKEFLDASGIAAEAIMMGRGGR